MNRYLGPSLAIVAASFAAGCAEDEPSFKNFHEAAVVQEEAASGELDILPPTSEPDEAPSTEEGELEDVFVFEQPDHTVHSPTRNLHFNNLFLSGFVEAVYNEIADEDDVLVDNEATVVTHEILTGDQRSYIEMLFIKKPEHTTLMDSFWLFNMETLTDYGSALISIAEVPTEGEGFKITEFRLSPEGNPFKVTSSDDETISQHNMLMGEIRAMRYAIDGLQSYSELSDDLDFGTLDRVAEGVDFYEAVQSQDLLNPPTS